MTFRTQWWTYGCVGLLSEQPSERSMSTHTGIGHCPDCPDVFVCLFVCFMYERMH